MIFLNNFFKVTLLISTAFLFFGCEDKNENDQNELSFPVRPAIHLTAREIEPYNPVTEIKLSFIGDCTLATQLGDNYEGSFNWYAENYDKEYFFEKVYPYTSNDDFTIANCENVFTDYALPETYKGYYPAFWFRSPSRNAEIFSAGDVEVVTVANNHTFDYNEEGMNHTIKAIESVDGLEWGGTDKDVILEKDDVKIGLICDTMWGDWEVDKIIERIQRLEKSTDIQVVYFHGGEEAYHTEEYWKVQACHELARAGADLIVGAHPHVLQPFETYRGVHIVYSIGNFCFGGNTYPENRTVVYQETFSFDRDRKKIVGREENIIPFYVFTGDTNNFQPAPIDDEYIAGQVTDFMYRKSDSLF